MTGGFDPGLVFVSYLIAVVASFTALSLARRVAQSEAGAAWRWLVAGAFAMGIGIWAMHFVGMLAYRMGMPHTYDVSLTALSLGAAILASGLALRIGSREAIGARQLCLGGLVMGIGIVGMHYIGMAAMRMAATISYRPSLFAASVVVAVLASTAALWMTFRASSRGEAPFGYKASAALVMGLAICGMHYIGMAAAVYTPVPGLHPDIAATAPTHHLWLAVTVSLASLIILFGTLLTSFFDYKLIVQKRVEEDLNRLIDARTRELTRTVQKLEVARDAAESAARAKNALLANMSHEIRTPLTGILGISGILAEEVTDPRHREFVELLEQGGWRLLETLNSVLELAQIESGALDLDLRPTAVAAAITPGLGLLHTLAERKGLTLHAHLDQEARALVDASALNRVVNHLVGNAMKFTERGSVTVRVERVGGPPGGVHLRVSDTGPGIEAGFLPHLFEEFRQGSTGDARSHEGSGLGLAITKRLVEMMGGQIRVESLPGRGTTFTVHLPPEPSEVAPETPPAGPTPRSPRRGAPPRPVEQ